MAFGFGRTTVAQAQVEINLNEAELNSSLRRAESQSRRTFSEIGKDTERAGRGALAASGAFSHLGRSIAFASSTFLGAAGLVSGVKASINAASDLNETISKSRVVFGPYSNEILSWAKNSAESFGLSQRAAIDAASGFDVFFRNSGIGSQKAKDMSKSLTQLSADVASFYNANPATVTEDINSALAGQIEPLRKYGIFLDQDRIKAEGLRLGLVKAKVDVNAVADANRNVAIAQAQYNSQLQKYGPNSTQAARALNTLHNAQAQVHKLLQGQTVALDAAQKKQATYSLIMRDSAVAHGDFARTASGLANSQRILSAEIENLEAELGKALLPTVTKVVHALTDWIQSIQTGGRNHEKFIRILTDVKNTISDVIGVIRRIVNAVGGWQEALKFILSGFLAKQIFDLGQTVRKTFILMSSTNPVILGLTALVLITTEIITHWKTVKGWFEKFWDWLRERAVTTALEVVEPFSHLPGRFGAWARRAKDALNRELDKIKADAAARGTAAGDAYGRSFATAAEAAITANAHAVSGAGGTVLRRGGTVISDAPGSTNAQTSAIVSTAKTAIGVPYQYGGAPSLSKPTDCSGLMVAVFAKNGISIPRTSQQQYAQAPIKNARPLLPGDLVFSEGNPHPGHVGLYIGDGLVLEDPHTGDRVKTIPLRDFGWNGLSARWWGGNQKTGTSTGSTTTPAPSVTTPAATTVTTPLHVGTTPKTPDRAAIPGRISQHISEAERTKSLLDDRKAYSDEVRWIKGQLENAKLTTKERTALEHDLTTATTNLQRINKKIQDDIAAKERARIIPKSSIERGLGALVTGANAEVRESASFQNIGKQIFDTRLGRITVNLQPDFQTVKKNRDALVKKWKALRVTLKSLNNQLKKELSKKKKFQHPAYIARLKREIKTTQDEMNDVAAAIDTDSDVLSAMAESAAEKKQADAAEADALEAAQAAATETDADDLAYLQGRQQQLQQEQSLSASQLMAQYGITPSELQGQLNDVNSQIAQIYQNRQDAAAQAAQNAADAEAARQQSLTQLPADIRLAQALAAGTTDTGDDVNALNRALYYYQNSLGQNPNIETQITLVGAINDVKNQIAQLLNATNTQTSVIASGTDEVTAVLNAQMSIRSQYAGNIFSPGSTRLGNLTNLPADVVRAVTVIQNFTSQPDDPFVWLRKSQFAASSVFG